MNEKQNTTANDPAVAPIPCPFCGCKTITVVEGSTFRWAKGECDNCGATCGDVRVNTMQTRNEDEIRAAVVEEWSKRHGSPHLIPASIFPTSVPALSAGFGINGWSAQQLNEWEIRLRDPDGNTWRIRDSEESDFGAFIFRFAKALMSNVEVRGAQPDSPAKRPS
jgi:hypothetical protein